MGTDELEEGYQAYLDEIDQFYSMEKIELALLLARLCVLQPRLPEHIEREMIAINLVKDYAKNEIKPNNYDNQNEQ